MSRIYTLGTALLASFTIAAVATASAFAAAPEFKPASGTLTFKSGTGKIEVKGASFGVTCKSDKGTGTITGPKTATFKLDYEGCTTLGGLVKCNSEGDSSGIVLLAGTGDLTKSGASVVLLLLTITPETGIECVGITITVLGESAGIRNNGLVCPWLPIGTKVKTSEHYTVTCATSAKGVNTFTKAVPPGGGAEATYILEAKEGSGAYEQASEETTEEISDSVESEVT